ncbi:hypothetical protein PJF56_18995 [Roseofilum sp. BLCC_M91]|uniref:Lipoprotein n=1 Tax=Roseofilum halophilum BLCC-M91 TaxID=3022259 RepID=A0ABT7BPE6_9CYAN|nr:hypothetical protein [Roseofilum halophilum]MDJ1180950.1 hypothetical protein [Roseofilum halophilum BLCC-M91]
MRFASDRLWLVGLILIMGCTAPEASEPNQESILVSSTEAQLASNLPESKTETISVEGEPQEITLKLYQEDHIRVVTYYPENISVRSACSHEGCGVSFELLQGLSVSALPTDEPLRARVHVFVPSANTTLEELEAGVTGDWGVFASNEWQQQPSNGSLSYPWETKNMNFFNYEKNLLGSVHLGESEGQVFRVTVVFPGDMGDGFAPRANVILNNLQVK